MWHSCLYTLTLQLIKIPLANAEALRDDDVLLFVCVSVCLSVPLSVACKYVKPCATWQQAAGALRIVSDTLVCLPVLPQPLSLL